MRSGVGVFCPRSRRPDLFDDFDRCEELAGLEVADLFFVASRPASSSHRSKSSKRSGRRERGQKTPTPDRISEIQQALAKDGSFTGKPNGKWDASTIEATRKFQEAHGLNATGKLDAKTLQQLGLGSETAGVAPPVPPVSSSSLRKPTPSPAAHQHQ